MQIALQAGLHLTDNDDLTKSLLRNRDGLRKEGVSIPRPNTYRKLLSEMMNSLEGQPPTPDSRDIFLDCILDDDPHEVTRVVLAQENLFCVPKIAFKGGIEYKNAEKRLKTIYEVFASDSLEIFLSLRNPATFLPTLLDATPHDDLSQLTNGLDPATLKWSNIIDRITSALPDTPITVWCYEDGPLIWGNVIRKIAAVKPEYPVIDANSRVTKIMHKEGAKRFQGFIADHPSLTEAQLTDTMIKFLDKYADPEKVEFELDVPGWDQAIIEYLTWQYEEDILNIGKRSNVTLISM